MARPSLDPVDLTRALIRCPSVTPAEAGALGVLEAALAPAGFACTRIARGGVENLYARRGLGGPVFGFAGHVDVVPPGDLAGWSADPFGAELRDGVVYGRGAADMKSAVAAFAAAAVRFAGEAPGASVALLIAGDEEGPAEHGTRAILDWMAAAGERLDGCLVGEPTSVERLGDVAKIGRRGSLTGRLTVAGRQGHAAYPERAANPLPPLVAILGEMTTTMLDLGSTHFQPSTLTVTSIDVGNPAANVIPAAGHAVFNIRFNDRQTAEGLRVWAADVVGRGLAGTGCTGDLDWTLGAEAFVSPPGLLSDLLGDALAARGMERPALTTGGGTSDARFIKEHCPVIEFGLVGDTMHAVDERVPKEDIRLLSDIYCDLLRRFFAS